jgi:type IV pilus biogenesis protein CpaD/CtpE
VVRLSFVPDNDAVDCDHITINYPDGTSHDVFSGTLLKDQRETITFPGTDSRLRSVDFACKAQHLDGARISLSAVSDGERAGGRYAERDNQDGIGDRAAHVRTYESADLDGR